MEYLPTGRASCGFKGMRANYNNVAGGPSLQDGRWHLVQCIKQSERLTLKVDEQTVAIKAIAVGSIIFTDDIVIGGYRLNKPNFVGGLDEALIEYFR